MEELEQIEKPVSYDLPEDLSDEAVIVLPERVNEEGVALYVDSSMELYKELRQDGLQVDYLSTPGGHKWVERLGIGDEVVIPLMVHVAGALLASGIWYAIERFATERNDSKNTRIKITIANRTSDPAWTWYEFEGSPKDVKELAEHVISKQEETTSKDR